MNAVVEAVGKSDIDNFVMGQYPITKQVDEMGVQ